METKFDTDISGGLSGPVDNDGKRVELVKRADGIFRKLTTMTVMAQPESVIDYMINSLENWDEQ